MTQYFKRDPAGVPQEITNRIAKRILENMEQTSGHATSWNLSQLGVDSGGDPAVGGGDSSRKISILNAPELLEAVKLAYRKHHLDDPDIGWDELSDKLGDALNNAMGADGYLAWMAAMGRGLGDE